tara:strand:+ start:798 stop:1028 length:231 start_codon:yes stop_codon:yes gene_type:complete
MAGFYIGSDLGDKTFYGFRLDADSGNLDVEVINDGTPVVLPQASVVDKNDYKQWVWTRDTLRFQWSPNGHLQVVFL